MPLVWHCAHCLESYYTGDEPRLDGPPSGRSWTDTLALMDEFAQAHVLERRDCRLALSVHVRDPEVLWLTSEDTGIGRAMREFYAEHPETSRPEAVYDQCFNYGIEFQRSLFRQRMAGVGLMSGLRTLADDPKAVLAVPAGQIASLTEGMDPSTLVTGGHFATVVDGLVIDWTYRQFEPESYVPRIVSVEQWKKEWSVVGVE